MDPTSTLALSADRPDPSDTTEPILLVNNEPGPSSATVASLPTATSETDKFNAVLKKPLI